MEQNGELERKELNAVYPKDMELEYPDSEKISELSAKYPQEIDLLYPGEEATEAMLAEAHEVSAIENFELELDYLKDDQQEDKLWQARTGLDADSLCGAIETIIFMSDRPVALQKIKNLIDEDLPLRVVHASLALLQEGYEEKKHGLRLVEVANGYQFRTKATYSKYVQDLFKVNSLVLTPTALEVMAIVSYKQPVSKTEVDKIRGVDSGHIVRGLMDKRLIKIVGRSEELGRPVLYGTTPEFLEVFNLANLSELPSESELEEVLDAGIGKITDIRTLVQAGDKKAFCFDEIDELEGLSETIKEITSDTAFTKSLKINGKKKAVESDETVKSAFDLLEEYVDKDIITKANTGASASELFTAITQAFVVNDLTAGPLNAPEEEEVEEDFQMIDLDTGLPLEEIQPVDANEEQLLADALDDAFAKLTGEKLEDQLETEAQSKEDLALQDVIMSEKEQDLEELTEKICEDAKELDLDLSFLQDNSEESTELTEDQHDN